MPPTGSDWVVRTIWWWAHLQIAGALISILVFWPLDLPFVTSGEIYYNGPPGGTIPVALIAMSGAPLFLSGSIFRRCALRDAAVVRAGKSRAMAIARATILALVIGAIATIICGYVLVIQALGHSVL